MLPARDAVEIGSTFQAASWKIASSLLSASRQKLADYLVLAKVRLSLLVLSTALVGFWLASPSRGSPRLLALFGLGAFLTIAAANALNQIAEREQDGLMKRTARRPLPAGRMGVGEALTAALLASAGGLALLFFGVNVLTGCLAAAALALYVFAYTPLKRKSPWSTSVGALSGAIPPLMGWSAAANEIGPPAWVLFGILFFWQFPHTWAIASLYREDYLRAGYRVLPLVDPRGDRTRRQVVAACLALLGVSLLPALLGVAGTVYLSGALALGLMLAGSGLRFGSGRSRKLAAQLMGASLIYMPLLLALMALDKKNP